ncbi:unnamed protein product [Caenorhabditis angaria]|uniref:Uncharacterized protein n=1 Tax=Caenorhabditis angaria TaxID=860376 RepID=A0A9P1IKE8_9PELO|nr:unnamed protein product [Caenorhabditis angaria]
MGDGANVFNTFSFNKWADGKREEEIDKESRKRRAEQIKRLKERLRKERALRESQGDGDLDLEALIEAIQNGQEINENPNDLSSASESTRPRRSGLPDVLTDDYIFNEIDMFSRRNRDLKMKALETDFSVPQPPPEIKKPDPLSWQYNRRNAENNVMLPVEKTNNNFKFNRKLNS